MFTAVSGCLQLFTWVTVKICHFQAVTFGCFLRCIPQAQYTLALGAR